MKGRTAYNIQDVHGTNDNIKVYTGRKLTRMDDQNRPEQYDEAIIMVKAQAIDTYGESLTKDDEVDGAYYVKGGRPQWQ